MREFQKKAECILNFTRFVEWPAEKFADAKAPFVIGVFGMTDITPLLQEAAGGRPIKGRKVVVRHLWDRREFRSCHVLFISRSVKERLDRILRHTIRGNVLTVGECESFLRKGGVIGFVHVDGAVRFQINPDAAEREKLSVSSKLLQLAVPIPAGAQTPDDPRAPETQHQAAAR